LREELSAEMRSDVPAKLIAQSWGRIKVTADVSSAAFTSWVADAQKVGFLRDSPDLSRFVASR
jgi:NitT/TauT family transport system substrate-binding protein